jgi:hypothetical protein
MHLDVTGLRILRKYGMLQPQLLPFPAISSIVALMVFTILCWQAERYGHVMKEDRAGTFCKFAPDNAWRAVGPSWMT